jgi:hypothetical protein
MEYQKDGIMEYWNDGEKNKMPKPIIPFFQYSNGLLIALFQFLEE